ncbi:MAG: hypothetical protein AUH43_06480 [Acidobacteria bacterium 13_1_40CM_65_14]|nr:MAG: hypothetical protein AUH43_06480 [Acidobacteria bacterium 13_1_40CM_65_14]OLC80162.1 MAG: hypothetical protein AUH72_12820 [Acidobacteria bacterium 13_1_40CM_4_65_8]OLD12463.1 MAG: hypothetical protein AUJ01_16245 [Acidobacteria bacterium 13_1_40CM_3_65_5]OLE81251.1 MAG: hypothetical protein AUF76_13410 [Acidobacteria bacterium 13_1_20CM_2_65_9]
MNRWIVSSHITEGLCQSMRSAFENAPLVRGIGIEQRDADGDSEFKRHVEPWNAKRPRAGGLNT